MDDFLPQNHFDYGFRRNMQRFVLLKNIDGTVDPPLPPLPPPPSHAMVTFPQILFKEINIFQK